MDIAFLSCCDDAYKEPHKNPILIPLIHLSTHAHTHSRSKAFACLYCCLSFMRIDSENIALEEDMPDSQLVAQRSWNRMDEQELRFADHLVYLPSTLC